MVEGLLSVHDVPDVPSSVPLKPGMYSGHVKRRRQEDSDFKVIFSYILNLRLGLATVLDPVSVPLPLPSSPPPKKGADFICSWNQSLSNDEVALDTAESGY